MTTAVQMQIRADTATNIAAATGASGELGWDTTNNRLIGNDGSLAGGYPHALVANLPNGTFRNLILGNVAGPQGFAAPTTPDNQVNVSADALSLFNSTLGVSYLALAVGLTNIDITTSGAGGLDTGSVAASKWYSVWVIYKPGTGIAGLLSLSTTSPTLPSGYTYKVRVGWMRTDAASHFLRVLQMGRRADYKLTNGLPLIAHGAAGTNGNVSLTLASVSVAAFIPPTASVLRGIMNAGYNTNSTTIVNVGPNTSWGGTNNGIFGSGGVLWPTFGIPGPTAMNAAFEFLLEASTIGWASGGAGGAIGCAGWEDNL